ncbi:class E sortase [Desertihabitans brevis]|uniref:Class E sortase n=1 Tax=Desertihabitans brevis TaxID=2268447 RepID=A0A367YQ50_9ACTN|nr:class E sortase [Desertihabitans brevis]RCK67964.1 class E sortase [Desertihabitans brevis]
MTVQEAPRRAGRPARRQPRNSALTVFGVGLLVIGLACLGYVGYQFFGTNIASQQAYEETTERLEREWAEAAPDAGEDEEDQQGGTPAVRIPGDAIGLLRIPDLGPDYVVPILTGTDVDTLTRGVGWYDSSVGPGELGNFAVAGHRVTHGEPFRHLLDLDEGAEIEVETRDAIYTYRLLTAPRDLTVNDTETWVLQPDPVNRSNEATREIMTLTTCQDFFHSPDRSVAFAELVETSNK